MTACRLQANLNSFKFFALVSGLGPGSRRMVCSNHWLSSIKTHTFLSLVRANNASNNSGLVFTRCQAIPVNYRYSNFHRNLVYLFSIMRYISYKKIPFTVN